MDAAKLCSVSDRLNAFLAHFHPHFIRREQRSQLALYSRGRLGPLERKSLEPIALAEGSSPRTLQQFLDCHVWDEDGVLDTHQRLVASEFGHPDGIFIVDGTSDAKKGTCTAGVARQYCGESGKVDNCITTLHWAYAGRDDSHVLLDGSLHLPPSWDAAAGEEASGRRQDARIPDDIVPTTHLEMSIAQLRRIRENGVPGRWVTGDAEFGGAWAWRAAIAETNLHYVAEVPSTLSGYSRRPNFRTPRAKPGRRGPKPRRPVADIKPQTAKKLAARMKPVFENWQVHEGTKGPEVWKVGRLEFFAANGSHPGQTQPGIMLICDNVITGDRKYFFSNAPADTTTAQLLRVAFSRWRVERCFQDAKGELGLNHAETRSWISIKRHLILTCVLHLFLTLLRREWGEKEGGNLVEPSGERSRGDAAGRVLGGERNQTPPNSPAPRQTHGTDGGAKPQGSAVGQKETLAATPRPGHQSIQA